MIILAVIDGLGIGSRTHDTISSTFGCLDMYIDQNSFIRQTKTYQYLLDLDNGHETDRSIRLSTKYKGADSYKGHFEMLGIKAASTEVYLEDCLHKLGYMAKKITKVCEGTYQLCPGCYVSNNIEADAGSTINMLVDVTKNSEQEMVKLAKDIRSELDCNRVIVMFSSSISVNSLKKATRENQYKERHISGVIPAELGLYGDTYRCLHIGRGLESVRYTSTTPNFLSNAVTSAMSVHLIGKPCDIFQLHDPHINNHDEIRTSDVGRLLEELVSQSHKPDVIFVNFQEVDLQCHARAPKQAALKLIEVIRCIEALTVCLQPNDTMIVTADHGNNPRARGHAHTKEDVPVVVLSNRRLQVLQEVDRNRAKGLGVINDITLCALGDS